MRENIVKISLMSLPISIKLIHLNPIYIFRSIVKIKLNSIIQVTFKQLQSQKSEQIHLK